MPSYFRCFLPARLGAVAMAVAMMASTLSATSTTAAESGCPVDRQVEELLRVCRGHRVGLFTNPTGVNARLEFISDLVHADPHTTLTAFFAPEHGLRGDRQAGASVETYTDPYTGVPVYSVYGAVRAPTDDQLATLDMLVFDIQDVGVRFYTYVWSMTHAMEAAAKNNKKFVVFDRPNPLGGLKVEGTPNRVDVGLIGRLWPGQPFGVATRHGMTVGEIARLVNTEWMDPKVDLTVIPIPGYTRGMTYAETGRPWVLPSPNMPTLDTVAVYPGMCVFEGMNISEGRGTTKPFELVGAPYIDGIAVAAELNALGLPGCRFRPAWFKPTFDDHANQFCGGIQIHVVDPETFDPIRAGLHALKVIQARYPDQAVISTFAGRLMGVPDLATRIPNETVESIVASWQDDLEAFKVLRAKHLLYPETRGTTMHVR